MKKRVGFDRTGPSGPIPEREFEIFGWKMRLVDAPAPQDQERRDVGEKPAEETC